MKRMFIAATLVAAVPSAYAQTGSGETYVSIGAGLTGESEFDYDFPGGNVEGETDTGYGIQAALGTRFSSNLRAEAVLSYSKTDISFVRRLGGPQILIYEEPGDIVTYMLGGNVYWDFMPNSAINPYIGAGAAIGIVDVNDRVISESAFGWKLQAMAGVDFALSDTSAVFVEGRYEAVSREIGDGLGFTDASDTLTQDSVGLYAGLRFGL